MSHSGWVHLEKCVVRRLTDKAALVEYEGERVWIPLSQIADPDDLEAGPDEVTVSVTDWIADQKGLS